MKRFVCARELFIEAVWLAERGMTHELLIDSVTDPYLHKAFVEFKKTLKTAMLDTELLIDNGNYLFDKIVEHLKEQD